MEIIRYKHDDLYINPFDLHAQPQGERGMVYLMEFLFLEYSLIYTLNTTLDCFVNFCQKIWEGY